MLDIFLTFQILFFLLIFGFLLPVIGKEIQLLVGLIFPGIRLRYQMIDREIDPAYQECGSTMRS